MLQRILQLFRQLASPAAPPSTPRPQSSSVHLTTRTLEETASTKAAPLVRTRAPRARAPRPAPRPKPRARRKPEPRTVWHQIYKPRTWEAYTKTDGSVTGVLHSMRAIYEQIRPGDWILIYISGEKRWCGLLEVISPIPTRRGTWLPDAYHYQLAIKPLIRLPIKEGLLNDALEGHVSWFAGPEDRQHYHGCLQRGLRAWQTADADWLVNTLSLHTLGHSVDRPIPHALQSLVDGIQKGHTLATIAKHRGQTTQAFRRDLRLVQGHFGAKNATQLRHHLTGQTILNRPRTARTTNGTGALNPPDQTTPIPTTIPIHRQSQTRTRAAHPQQPTTETSLTAQP